MKPTKSRGNLVRLGIAAAAIAMAIPTSASAQRGPGARGGFANNPGIRLWTELDQRFDGFTDHLSLSEEQTGQVTALVDDFRDKNKNVLGRFQTMMAEMRSRMGGGARRGGRRGWRQPPGQPSGHAGTSRPHAATRPRLRDAAHGHQRGSRRRAGEEHDPAAGAAAAGGLTALPATRPSSSSAVPHTARTTSSGRAGCA